jgi:hypothetical protein
LGGFGSFRTGFYKRLWMSIWGKMKRVLGQALRLGYAARVSVWREMEGGEFGKRLAQGDAPAA